MQRSDVLTHDEAIARCEGLVEQLAERAGEGEALRQLPAATMTDLERLGLWQLVVPTQIGGHGLGVTTLAECARILARGCVSTGWTASFFMMHNWLAARFPEQARGEFFPTGRPWAFVPAPLAPTGTMAAVDGGYVVSGRWEWATGVRHADWVLVHAVMTEPELTTRFVAVPIDEVAVDDVWFTSGMRATGSDTVRLESVFVPQHRTMSGQTLMGGEAMLGGDGMAGLPIRPVLAMMAAAPALGGAERAVELFRQRIADRVLAFSMGERAVEQPAAQIRLGTVLSELASAQARFDRALADLDRLAGTGQATDLQRVSFRLAAAATVRSARTIVSTIGEGSGASVYFEGSEFQRIQRDIEVLKGHVIFDWDRTTELVGKVALGMPLQSTDLA